MSNIAMLPGWRVMAVKKRTDHIAAAVAAELDRQRPVLNALEHVRSVTVTIRFKNGTDTPRCVIVQTETERLLEKE